MEAPARGGSNSGLLSSKPGVHTTTPRGIHILINLTTVIYFKYMKFQRACRKLTGLLEQNCKSKH